MLPAISVHNVSKLYHLGETNRSILLGEARRWFRQTILRRSPPGDGQSDDASAFWALKDISLDIKEGEVLGIIGRNGAGKSTLLKILSRITAPSTGHVKVRGRIGSLLEVGTGFHPELTGRDNVYLNGTILGMTMGEVRAKFDDIVSFAETGQFIDTPVKRYSSGMRMRLAFAVSAFLEPEIMILDEALGVGDMAFQMKCDKRLEELVNRNHTIIFVAHDTGSMAKYCDNVLWLEKGAAKEYGSTESVLEKYRDSQAKFREASTGSATGHEGTGEFVITQIVIHDHEHRPTQKLTCGKPCTIHFTRERRLWTSPAITSMVLRFFIYDEFNSRMFALSSKYGPEPLQVKDGTATIVCEIPKLPLLPGKYRIDYELLVNEERSDARLWVATMEVLHGDFYGSDLLPPRASTTICVDCSWHAE